MKFIIISIVVIVVAVALYGIFATTTTETSGGGTQEVHSGALGWLKGILSGLNLSVVGG